MMNPWTFIQTQAAADFTLFGLRVLISLWALVVVIIAWTTKNKWLLGGMLAYEVLP